MRESLLSRYVTGSFFAIGISFIMITAAWSGTIIQGIDVEGNKRIESTTISSNSTLKVGQDVTQDDLDVAVQGLFDTGYFSDVKVELQGNRAVIKVVENPIVNHVAFEGNSEFDDETLGKQIHLQPRQVYTLTKLKHDTKVLHDLYRIKGYFGAQVTPKIIRRDQNRVDVIFEVKEGGATKVAQIIFVGNKHYKSDKLKRVINTKESRWYRFFSSDDTYDPDRLALDQELLRRYYLENGYVDFRVQSAVAELTPDQKEFFITFTVEEGERYKFGKINLDLQVENIDEVQLRQEITVKEEDWYSTKELDKTIKALTDYLGNHGYAFVDIRPKADQDRERKIVNITFEVLEGPKVYIDRILITGNVRTNEDVIRRELLVYEGDAYNTFRLKRSEQRIKNLGFFKNVKFKERPSDAPDKVDLIVEVDEEESTGELWVAGGYSTAEGFLANVGIKENNLMGRGQSARLSGTISKKRQQIDLGFTEPNFLNRHIRAGFDVYNINSKKYFNSSFEHKKTGFALRMSYDLTEYLSQGWTYFLSFDRVTDIRSDASRFIRDQAGNSTTSGLQHRLFYDRRDDRFETTSGYYLGMTNEITGLGGTVKYLKNELSAGYYYSIVEDWVLSFSGSGGVMDGIMGKDVRIVDRFNMGGDGSLRGFRESGAETRDSKTLDPLGGLKYYLGTVELGVPFEPFGVPNEFGIKGHLFSDVGAAWDAEEPKSEVLSSSSPRASVGFGISWKSPLGPLRIDFARDVVTKGYDRHKTIHFGFFTRF